MGVAPVGPEPGDRTGPEPPADAHRPGFRGREGTWLVVALGALSAFGPLCMDMYLPALPDLPVSLHSTATAAQLSLSACIIGLAGGQLLVGPISDRRGRRLPLLVGLAVFVLASVACAVATSMPLLIGLRFLQGAAGAAGIVISRAIVSDKFTGVAAASYFSTIAAINGLSPILAPVLGAQVLRAGDWRTVFWVLSGIGVLMLILTLLVVGESLPVDRRSSAGPAGTLRAFRILFADRIFLGWAMAGTAVSAAMFGYISASPFLLQTGFGLSPQLFSACFATNALGIVAMSQLGRFLLRRRTPVALLSWGVGQCLVGALLLGVALLARLGLAPVLVTLFVMVSAAGFALPFSSVLAMDRHRQVAGSASALLGTAQFAIGAIAAPLVGFGDRTAGTALAFTTVGIALIGAVTLIFTRRAASRAR